MSKVLSLTNITRIYVQGERQLMVLNGLHLQMNPGEVVALVGPSGSGKTTLLQIVGLLDTPTQGEVVIQGEAMHHASEQARTLARRKHIGFVYQFHHLLPEFSALENVVLPQMIAGIAENKAHIKAMDLLGSVGLADRASHRPARLSGGEQQRVAIARALANDPVLLLADEPTGNLDQQTADGVFSVLMQAVRTKKMAALIATHNADLAKRMDRIVTLKDGRLA